ncbi:MAG: hypothetical protein RL367_66 [Pseudomonadota bacterium]
MANFRGNSRNNWITGTSSNDTIDGMAGDDHLDGGAGNDIIYGGTGNDSLFGGTGNDSLYGGDDNDVLNGGLNNDLLDGGAGEDTASYAGIQANNFINLTTGIAYQQWSGLSVGQDSLISIENVVGGDYSDYVTGSAGNNKIWTGAGNDAVYATAGQDMLDGGAGSDTVIFDTVSAGVTASLVSASYSWAGSSGTMAGFEAMSGSNFGDTLTGDAGNNKIDGRDGADILAGGLGNDQIWGGRGSDVLIADGGNDELCGNYSFEGVSDRSSDTFIVMTNANIVTIADFAQGEDKLDLTAFGFDSQGYSPYWTGSSTLVGTCLVLKLTNLVSQTVEIRINGITPGEAFSASDMIGGSPSLEYHQTYPLNGGNGVQDITVINPANGNVVINNFENGLDKLDISAFIHNGWGGFLGDAADGSVMINFGNGTDHFSVTLTGVTVGQIDASDYVM